MKVAKLYEVVKNMPLILYYYQKVAAFGAFGVPLRLAAAFDESGDFCSGYEPNYNLLKVYVKGL